MADVVDDKVLSEEFKLWKKNIPFMYDFIMTRASEYPSPSVQWFTEQKAYILENDETETEDKEKNSKDNENLKNDEMVYQQLLFGTNTNEIEENNYLVVASVSLPGYPEPKSKRLYELKEDEWGSFSSFLDHFEVDVKIPHEGVVTCARYMPQRNNIVASKSDVDLFVYDIKDRLENPDSEKKCLLNHLHGHNSRIALEWNTIKAGHFLSCSEDKQLNIWNVNSQKKGKLTQSTKLDFKKNDKNVFLYDASWHRLYPEIVGATSSQGDILLWDTRSSDLSQPSHCFRGHEGSAFQIKFNPFSEYIFITSGSDRQISMWDLRNLKVKLHAIRLKNEKFSSLKWNPHQETVFAATTNDRKVYVFDLERTFDEQLPCENEDGPPTLLFLHSGHTSKVYDFDWNPNPRDPAMICSVSDDNVFQIWQMMTAYFHKDASQQGIPGFSLNQDLKS